MKKIYFACSISGGREHAHVYEDIVKIIKGTGLEVLSEIFADKNMDPNKGPGEHSHFTPAQIWESDLSWLKQAHAVIAEVTQPSLGVGYEIAKAHEWSLPVLALHKITPGHRISPMISGSPNVMVFEYKEVPETKNVIAQFVKQLG
jgi:hypothetical protein